MRQTGQRVADKNLGRINSANKQASKQTNTQTNTDSSSCAMHTVTFKRLQLYFSPVYFAAMLVITFGGRFRRKSIHIINFFVFDMCERQKFEEKQW
jgi:hypothetical protein